MKRLFIVVFILFLVGCSRLKAPFDENNVFSTKGENEIEGIYSHNGKMFFEFLKFGRQYKSSADTVGLKFLEDRKLEIKLFRGSEWVNSMIVKGRFRKGYFYIDQKYHFRNLLIIGFYYEDAIMRLTTSKEGGLVIQYDDCGWLFALGFGFYFLGDKEGSTTIVRVSD